MHDAGVLADSGLLNYLQRFAISATGQPMCIYEDPAYRLRGHLQAPFREVRLTPQMQAYNDAVSEIRVFIELLCVDRHYSLFLNSLIAKKLKIEHGRVGKMYVVFALLRNGITCL